MSVIITNMDRPKNCVNCKIECKHKNTAHIRYSKGQFDTPNDCPFKPVEGLIKEIEDWQRDIHDNEHDALKFDFIFERIYEIIKEYCGLRMTGERAIKVIRDMLAFTDLTARGNMTGEMVEACHVAIEALRDRLDSCIELMPHLEPDNCGNYIVSSVDPTRAKGEWILSESDESVHCSKCNAEYESAHNFCPHCGADMRGGE